jgi:hypothetical protein
MAFSPDVKQEARGLATQGRTIQEIVDLLNKKYHGLMTFKHPTVGNWVRDIINAREYSQDNAAPKTELVQPKPNSVNSVVLAIPDLHCPFEHPDALAFLIAVRDKIKPDKIVCLGDEIDAHAYSRWPKDPDGMGAGQELKAAIEALIPFYVAFPNVQVCVSNHTIRPKKMMRDIGLPAAFWPKYETMLNAPDGWSWHEHIVIDDVLYIHGDQGKGGMNGWTKNSEVYHKSTVVGHWHSKAGVYYDSAMFNVNAGCLINQKAYAFDYAKNSHKKPNLGCAIISHGRKAAFLPMLTDAEGRWIGEL